MSEYEAERVYCAHCLHLLRDGDRGGQHVVVGCCYCNCGLLVTIGHSEMLRAKAAMRTDLEAAERDGLIRSRP